MKKFLILAQTPPPFHGQAVMQQYLVKVNWPWCRKEHLRLEYSDDIQQVGRFSLQKVAKLGKLLQGLYRSKRQQPIDVLYYPPAGPNRIPLYRDMITLFFARLWADKVVLHFHAGGLSELVGRMHPAERFLVKKAFSGIDHAIVLLPWLTRETKWFAPKQVHVVANGMEDVFHQYISCRTQNDPFVNILFVGNLKEEKGIFVLLEAVAMIRSLTVPFKVQIMGAAHSEEVANAIRERITELGINDRIEMLGTLTGADKWKAFANAQIFCLPTFATEAMPVSIIEAMMFALPTVTTDWRAIPDVIENGIQGLLAPVKDAASISHHLYTLITDGALREKMGEKAREKYRSFFTIEQHLLAMENVFREASATTGKNVLPGER